MTSPYVTGTAHSAAPARRPSPAPRREWWRATLAALVMAAAVLGAGIAGIIAAITWTGCFIGCTGENHAGGAALAVLAALSLASGPAAVSGLYRSATWLRVAVVTFGLAIVAGALLLTAA